MKSPKETFRSNENQQERIGKILSSIAFPPLMWFKREGDNSVLPFKLCSNPADTNCPLGLNMSQQGPWSNASHGIDFSTRLSLVGRLPELKSSQEPTVRLSQASPGSFKNNRHGMGVKQEKALVKAALQVLFNACLDESQSWLQCKTKVLRGHSAL